ncbi:VOC family protein [Aestuariispira insulae]|uniref:Glyoxalase-like protein n=1 Tax=Aestuariispira insulae TaxID=1461337 RepID=A0A3D9HV38_9PROT|nr:VOC family protein [Aestuariispira insulae]RED53241.1 glyoxalase-like protein [Aestuariispira insulae]
MRIVSLFPVFPTKCLEECRQFYQNLGFQISYEDDFFLHLSWRENPLLQIGFKKAQTVRPSNHGILALEVEDVDAVYALLKDKGMRIEQELEDLPWQHRQFSIRAPDGQSVEVFTQTE